MHLYGCIFNFRFFYLYKKYRTTYNLLGLTFLLNIFTAIIHLCCYTLSLQSGASTAVQCSIAWLYSLYSFTLPLVGIRGGAGISATANTFAINILVHIVGCPCARDCFVYMTSFFGNQQYSTRARGIFVGSTMKINPLCFLFQSVWRSSM